MNIVVGSIFRDADRTLPGYFAQVNEFRRLAEFHGHHVRLVVVENDSKDNTAERLEDYCIQFVDSCMLTAHDDCPHYESIDYQPRWQHIAWVCNHILSELEADDDLLFYVESDLAWDPEEMVNLCIEAEELGAVTVPNYKRERGGIYYDTWGSAKDGLRFAHNRPYHPGWEDGLMAIDACASVLAVDAQIARKAKFSDQDAFRGFSKEVKLLNGGHLWMDTAKAVLHP